ncbi:MAG TPA: biopolymer transporter ExbD [Gemmata sp.]|nr:biopolymer transporter ExbD [Gemmata sp.]
MSKAPKAFDVWFVAANTVYKAVPYSVVADWAQEGRLAAADMVRPAGTTVPWVAVGAYELLADYVPRQSPQVVVPAEVSPTTEPVGTTAAAPAADSVELPEAEEVSFRRPASEEDDDVDMIPLIDVSMVLLVFFILMRAAGALAPVDVPEMRYAGQLSNDPEAITIDIDKKDEFTVFYAVRQGQTPPQPNHNMLPKPEDAIKALGELLASAQRPPEVRIACRKDLPRERVYELRRELEGMLKKNQINSFAATVIEAPQQK